MTRTVENYNTRLCMKYVFIDIGRHIFSNAVIMQYYRLDKSIEHVVFDWSNTGHLMMPIIKVVWQSSDCHCNYIIFIYRIIECINVHVTHLYDITIISIDLKEWSKHTNTNTDIKFVI